VTPRAGSQTPSPTQRNAALRQISAERWKAQFWLRSTMPKAPADPDSNGRLRRHDGRDRSRLHEKQVKLRPILGKLRVRATQIPWPPHRLCAIGVPPATPSVRQGKRVALWQGTGFPNVRGWSAVRRPFLRALLEISRSRMFNQPLTIAEHESKLQK
jgi:hypothetical protein